MLSLSRRHIKNNEQALAAVHAPLIRAIGSLLLLFAPLTMLLLWFQPSLNTRILNNAPGHMIFVGSGALIGIGLAWLVLVTALRMNDRRALLIGLALLSNALVFIVHGISTPSVVFIETGDVPNATAKLSLMVGSFFFAASAFELSKSDRFSTSKAWFLILAVLLCWAAGSWYLLSPFVVSGNTAWSVARSVTSPAPGHEHMAGYDAVVSEGAVRVSPGLLDGLFVISLVCYLFTLWRYFAIVRSHPSKVSLALLYGVMLLCMALIVQSMSQAYTPLFWVYHIQELAASVLLSIALLTDYRQSLDSSSILESLLLPHTRSRIEANYANALDELIRSLASGKRPAGNLRHTLRQRFSLSETQIQTLERAAQAVAAERQQRQELEKLTGELQQLQHDKEMLVQLVVHDLKNPLTAVIGFLDLLRYTELTAMQAELSSSALRSAKNLQYLISDLLDIARLDEGKLQLHYSSVHVPALLTEIHQEMEAWLEQQQQSLEIHVAPDFELEADEHILRRILRNLISNAIKHTPADTRIRVQAAMLENEPGYCQILVQDNGPGIPAHVRDTLFQRFGRLNAANPAAQQNTGLGLFFCHLAVEAHAGTLGVLSEEGQGTTFWIKLPTQHREQT